MEAWDSWQEYKLRRFETFSNKKPKKDDPPASTNVEQSKEEATTTTFLLDGLHDNLISLVGAKLSTQDRLNLKQAYPNSAAAALLSPQKFIQRRLLLLIHPFDYHPWIGYTQWIDHFLKPFFELPETHLQPATKEEEVALTYTELKQHNLLPLARLQHTFPWVQTLKVVMRGDQDKFDAFQAKLLQAVAAFSGQLVTLQVVISTEDDDEDPKLSEGESRSRICRLKMGNFVATLNLLKWPRLKHFCLYIADNVKAEEKAAQELTAAKRPQSRLDQLKLLSSVETCYLRVSGRFLLRQLPLLQANDALRELGFIVSNQLHREAQKAVARATLSFSPAFAAKVRYMHLVNYMHDGELTRNMLGTVGPTGSRPGAKGGPSIINSTEDDILAGKLRHFSGLTALRYNVRTWRAYQRLLAGLVGASHLRCLLIHLSMTFEGTLDAPVDGDVPFGLASYQLLTLPSVTSLTIYLDMLPELDMDQFTDNHLEIYRLHPDYNHQLIELMALVRHFPRLQQLHISFEGDCAICAQAVGNSAHCLRKLIEPLKELTSLRQLEFSCLFQRDISKAEMEKLAQEVLKVTAERRERQQQQK